VQPFDGVTLEEALGLLGSWRNWCRRGSRYNRRYGRFRDDAMMMRVNNRGNSCSELCGATAKRGRERKDDELLHFSLV
jgi:hypothetical protein